MQKKNNDLELTKVIQLINNFNKKNDYLELAVKDIRKLASEGDYERVAFTNPATQLMRNDKSLEYIDEIEINQVPKLTEAEQQFNKTEIPQKLFSNRGVILHDVYF